MAWVKGIREVHYIDVPIDLERRGPIRCRRQRTITELPSCALGGTIRSGPLVFLPVYRGAGPCGTHARVVCWRAAPGALPLEWSLKHLVEPLRAYYAAYEPPMRFGAKSTPRGRRAA